jgi:hypothetical protein
MTTVAKLSETPDTVEEYPAPEIVKQQALYQDWAAESAKFIRPAAHAGRSTSARIRIMQ